MDLNDAAPQAWQEERFTLQRLLVQLVLPLGSRGRSIVPFGNSDSPEELFDLGDKALYRAKNEGRNRVVRA